MQVSFYVLMMALRVKPNAPVHFINVDDLSVMREQKQYHDTKVPDINLLTEEGPSRAFRW